MSTPKQQKLPAPPGQRRKTAEACNLCRARKSKCDGAIPCKSCVRSNQRCDYDSSTSVDKLIGMRKEFDSFHQRLQLLESLMLEQPFSGVPLCLAPQITGRDLINCETNTQSQAVMTFNSLTRSSEFYGSTSILALARNLSNQLKELEREHWQAEVPSKRPRIDTRTSEIELDGLFERNDFIPIFWDRKEKWHLRNDMMNSYVHTFFDTIHDYLPILDPNAFMVVYCSFWDTHQVSNAQSVSTQQAECLIYSVLAMGALYSDSQADNAEWAASYFSKAQDLLGRLFDAVSIETVQAALLVGCYAQHVLKPNLANNYIGVAIRFAYSIGLNTSCRGSHNDEILRAASRCWWMLYGVEAEQCLDSGRPTSIREADAKAPFPEDISDTSIGISRVTFITVMAKFSMITRKIIDLIASTGGETNTTSLEEQLLELHVELCAWREGLPLHLRFDRDPARYSKPTWATTRWVKRQRQSVEVHFNHLLILLYQPSFRKTSTVKSPRSLNVSAPIYLSAAQENVRLIHHILNENRSMRRWAYYCYYCMTATLALLIHLCECPEDELDGLLKIMKQSIEIFEAINSEPSKRCVALVNSVLAKLGHTSTQIAERQSSQQERINEENESNFRISPDDVCVEILDRLSKDQSVDNAFNLSSRITSEELSSTEWETLFNTDS